MKTLSFIINLALYFMLLSGIVLIFYNSFASLSGWLFLRRRLTLAKRDSSRSITGKLSELVYNVSGKENKGRLLLAGIAMIFVFVFIIGNMYYSILVSLIIALLTAFVPIISLVSKLLSLRSRSSNEGQSFVGELYRQYRVSGKNIYSALETVSGHCSEFPVCGKQSYLLLLKLRAAGGKDEIRDSCRGFAASLGSVWGKTLAVCIECACGGTDISDALIDIIKQLKQAKALQEEKKRLNSEATRMTTFLVPILYIGTVFISVKFLGLPFSKLLKNQFGTPGGFMLFTLGVLLFVLNSFVLSLITDSRLDY